MTSASGSSASGDSTMIERDVWTADDREVVEVDRAAACGRRSASSGRCPAAAGADLVLHLDLVPVGEDDDRWRRLVGVGRDELAR